QKRKQTGEEHGALIHVQHRFGLNRMGEKDYRRDRRNPRLKPASQQMPKQNRISNVNCHVHDVEACGIVAAHEEIQVEGKECELAQMQWIEEVEPARRI